MQTDKGVMINMLTRRYSLRVLNSGYENQFLDPGTSDMLLRLGDGVYVKNMGREWMVVTSQNDTKLVWISIAMSF